MQQDNSCDNSIINNVNGDKCNYHVNENPQTHLASNTENRNVISSDMISSTVNCNLRPIEEIPLPYRNVFGQYPFFNIIQSKLFNDVFYSDESIVVSAPTGSGKTVIFELAIIKLLMSLEVSRYNKEYKMIYIAPMKALCEERVVDWHRKFSNLGVTCISITGDSVDIDYSSLINNNLIITTPEKWDSLTRKWRDNEKIVKFVKLFMIDEIHLLNDETRGPTLEAIVSRMKTTQNFVNYATVKNINDIDVPDKIRFIGTSATISNISDIAEWFGPPMQPASYFKFEDDMRPVKLEKIVLGYHYNPSISTPFKFDIMLNYKLSNIMLQYAIGKPTLIFCSTRKSVEMTSRHLMQNLTINLNQSQKQVLLDAATTIDDPKVKEILIHGVGSHHAGMLPDNRKAIENLFREGNLPILVTTSTLAMGVNLPAHLVIIKSTKYYTNGGYQDYSESTLYQMIGRAGRPQFDTSATAVIMTTAADKNKFENMVGGEQPIESFLHRHLAEYVNAEVVLGTITDLGVAMQWLTSTFLYIRARKNPRFYGLQQELTSGQLDKKLLDMCHIEINKLARNGMLTIDQNIIITPTFTGSLMARYCIALETMKLFTKVTGKESLQQMLNLISKCHEFSDIRLRSNDKKTLNLLNRCRNKKTIRFPLSGKIKTLDMKINCIIQAVLGCLEIVESSLLVEAQRIMRIGERLLNCLVEYLEPRACYSALLNTITLAKCFHARIWEDSHFVSRQLVGIGMSLSHLLVAAGKTTFEAILDSNPRDLERILNRKTPTGNKIQDQVSRLPKYSVLAKEAISEDTKTLEVSISLDNVANFKNDITVNPDNIMHFLIGDSENNVILYEKYTHAYMLDHPNIFKVIDIEFNNCRNIFVNFISQDWVGIDAQTSIELFSPTHIPHSVEVNHFLEEKQIERPISKAESEKQIERPISKAESEKMKKMPKMVKREKAKSVYIQQFMDTYFKEKGKTARSTKINTNRDSEKKETEHKSKISKNSNQQDIIKPESNNGDENNLNKLSETEHKIKISKNPKQDITKPKSDNGDENNLKKLSETEHKSKISKNPNQQDTIKPEINNGDENNLKKLSESAKDDIKKGNSNKTTRIESVINQCNNNYIKSANKNVLTNIAENHDELKKRNEFGSKLNENCINNEESQSRCENIPQYFNLSQKCIARKRNISKSDLKTRKKIIRQRIAEKQALNPFEFEFSLYQSDDEKPRKIVDIKDFVKTPKKKLSHEVEQSVTNNIVDDDAPDSKKMKFGEKSSKTITWRSPLVDSPYMKCSPYLNVEPLYSKENTSFEKSLDVSISSKNSSSENINSLLKRNRPTLKKKLCNISFADKYWDDITDKYNNILSATPIEANSVISNNNQQKTADIEDILSTTLLDSLGVKSKTDMTDRSKSNDVQNIMNCSNFTDKMKHEEKRIPPINVSNHSEFEVKNNKLKFPKQEQNCLLNDSFNNSEFESGVESNKYCDNYDLSIQVEKFETDNKEQYKEFTDTNELQNNYLSRNEPHTIGQGAAFRLDGDYKHNISLCDLNITQDQNRKNNDKTTSQQITYEKFHNDSLNCHVNVNDVSLCDSKTENANYYNSSGHHYAPRFDNDNQNVLNEDVISSCHGKSRENFSAQQTYIKPHNRSDVDMLCMQQNDKRLFPTDVIDSCRNVTWNENTGHWKEEDFENLNKPVMLEKTLSWEEDFLNNEPVEDYYDKYLTQENYFSNNQKNYFNSSYQNPSKQQDMEVQSSNNTHNAIIPTQKLFVTNSTPSKLNFRNNSIKYSPNICNWYNETNKFDDIKSNVKDGWRNQKFPAPNYREIQSPHNIHKKCVYSNENNSRFGENQVKSGSCGLNENSKQIHLPQENNTNQNDYIKRNFNSVENNNISHNFQLIDTNYGINANNSRSFFTINEENNSDRSNFRDVFNESKILEGRSFEPNNSKQKSHTNTSINENSKPIHLPQESNTNQNDYIKRHFNSIENNNISHNFQSIDTNYRINANNSRSFLTINEENNSDRSNFRDVFKESKIIESRRFEPNDSKQKSHTNTSEILHSVLNKSSKDTINYDEQYLLATQEPNLSEHKRCLLLNSRENCHNCFQNENHKRINERSFYDDDYIQNCCKDNLLINEDQQKHPHTQNLSKYFKQKKQISGHDPYKNKNLKLEYPEERNISYSNCRAANNFLMANRENNLYRNSQINKGFQYNNDIFRNIRLTDLQTNSPSNFDERYPEEPSQRRINYSPNARNHGKSMETNRLLNLPEILNDKTIFINKNYNDTIFDGVKKENITNNYEALYMNQHNKENICTCHHNLHTKELNYGNLSVMKPNDGFYQNYTSENIRTDVHYFDKQCYVNSAFPPNQEISRNERFIVQEPRIIQKNFINEHYNTSFQNATKPVSHEYKLDRQHCLPNNYNTGDKRFLMNKYLCSQNRNTCNGLENGDRMNENTQRSQIDMNHTITSKDPGLSNYNNTQVEKLWQW